METAEDARARRIAELAAECTVQRVFRQLGIDLENIDSTNALRDDWTYLRVRREAADHASRDRYRGWFSLAIAVISSILTGVGSWVASFWWHPRG
jgi:hypothetical protein